MTAPQQGLKTTPELRLPKGSDVHTRLRLLREREGISQSQCARILETSQPNIGRWEKATAPSPEWLGRLAKLYAVPVDWLVYGDEADTPAREINAISGQTAIPIVGIAQATSADSPPRIVALNDAIGGQTEPRTASIPLRIPKGNAAIEVQGDSHAPAFQDRDLLIYDPHSTASLDALQGKLCVVRLKDGMTMIASPEANPESTAIVWAAPILLRILV